MKVKELNKKLRLNKKTIADLDDREMNEILGRGPESTKMDSCSICISGCGSNPCC